MHIVAILLLLALLLLYGMIRLYIFAYERAGIYGAVAAIMASVACVAYFIDGSQSALLWAFLAGIWFLGSIGETNSSGSTIRIAGDHYVYMYTASAYQQRGWYKIGKTTQTPDVRIKQQDSTSNPEPLKLIRAVKVSSFGYTATEAEQRLHRYFDGLGRRVRSNREWFNIAENEFDAAVLEVLPQR